MTDRITEARQGLVTLLDDFKVYAVRPAKVQGAVIVVEASDPYIQPGLTYSDLALNVSLTCIVEKGQNDLVTEKANTLIIDVIEALRGEWSLVSVTVGELLIADYLYTAASIQIKTNI